MRRLRHAALGAGALAAFMLVSSQLRLLTELSMVLYMAGRYLAEGLPVSKVYNDFMYIGYCADGILFQRENEMARAKLYRMLSQVEPHDDHMTAICKVSMYTEMTTGLGYDELFPPGLGNLDTMDPVTTEERVAMYVEACRQVYLNLDPGGEQRKLLERLPARLAVNVTTPYRLAYDPSYVVEGVKARDKAALEQPDLAPRWKPQEEIGRWADLYVKHGYRPVREEIIPASGIADAVWNGKVAVFNATELLGGELFNKSIPEIAALHGDLAKTTPMYRQKGAMAAGTSGFESLHDYGQRIDQWSKAGIITYPENTPWYPLNLTEAELEAGARARSERGGRWLDGFSKLCDRWLGSNPAEHYHEVRKMLLQCAVNTRRLTKLPIPRIEDALGNPEWLERAWSMFWLGPNGDCWHYDDPDNLLIGVRGDIYVTVFEQQDREVMRANMDRGCWSPSAPIASALTNPRQLDQDAWAKRYPFITMKLEPGMGVVVPSGTFHSLTMPSGDRILMNVFMMPKYKGLWDAPASRRSFYGRSFQSEAYAAMRALKLSTIYRVWDTKKIGGWFEGSKLEIL